MSVKIDPELKLPVQFTEWRDSQYQTVNAIVNCTKPHFLADLPTGTGKSLIGVGAHRMTGKRAIYLCGTKQLQDQIMRDFADIAVTLKGKNNYPCALHYDEFPQVTAEDCSLSKPRNCEHFSQCEYYQQKQRAIDSPLAVLNNAYYLNEVNGFNSSFAGAELLIVDEIDALDNALMSYVEIRITSRQLERYGLNPPKNTESKESWLEWIPGALEALQTTSGRISETLRYSDFKHWTKIQIENNRLKKSMEKLSDKLETLASDLDYSWVFYSNTSNGQTEWVFKPVNIGVYANRYLWRYSEFAVGMSGTIFSADITCRELGITECDYMQLPCSFPVENRPIYFNPVVNLSRSSMSAELPVLKNQIEQDLSKYPNQKVLIHTVSYAVRNYLLENLDCQGRMVTHESNTREEALENFKRSRKPLVMLSPSFDRGVDLRESDNCGAVMVCKMPYLSLGDPQVSAKVKTPGGWTWYALKAAQTLVQMTGRSVRSETQKCDTYIYDKQFSRLLGQMRNTIPTWWQDAIQEVRNESKDSKKLAQIGMLI